MLKLAGETDIGLERFEQIKFNPGERVTPDLEAGTSTITASAKGGGADYSAALTLLKPDDARIEVLRIAARLQVTRDSGTSSNLYCSVYVDDEDGSEADHCLFDGVDIQASSLYAQDTLVGTKEVIFDLLKDGAEHTFYFFFWVDAGDSVISLVKLWESVGTCATEFVSCLRLRHAGLAGVGCSCRRAGSGTPQLQAFMDSTYNPAGVHIDLSGHDSYSKEMPAILIPDYTYIWMKGSVATDLNHFYRSRFVLRSEQ